MQYPYFIGQTTLIRYQWLEAFVNHGSSHLQGIAEAVDAITRDICPPRMTELQDGSPAADRPTLLDGLHELLLRSRAQEQENVVQRQELDALIAAMREDMRLNAEMRNAHCTCCVQALSLPVFSVRR